MSTRFTELHCKEVICVCDGRRLGFISDVCVEIPSGCIQAVIVPGPSKCFGLLGRAEEYSIPWNRIQQIGPDIVLVDIKPEECRCRREKPRLFF